MNTSDPPSEDILEYEIYSLDQETVALEELRDYYRHYLETSLKNYVWHADIFKLTKVQVLGGESVVKGHIKLGTDSGQLDEWLAISLLFDFSRIFRVACRAWDTDGEFLLIEAADAVPEWLTPETGANRVWIRSGQVVLVREGLETGLSTAKALQHVRSGTAMRNEEITKIISKRIIGLPDNAMKLNQHLARVTIPDLQLINVLLDNPCFLPAIVNAFYHRSPDQLKTCAPSEFSKPTTPLHTNLWISRPLYAMLRLQIFQPPSKLARYYANCKSQEQWTAMDLGMKLLCGADIFAAVNTAQGRAFRNAVATVKERTQADIDDLAINQNQHDSEDWMRMNGKAPQPQTAFEDEKSQQKAADDLLKNARTFMEDDDLQYDTDDSDSDNDIHDIQSRNSTELEDHLEEDGEAKEMNSSDNEAEIRNTEFVRQSGSASAQGGNFEQLLRRLQTMGDNEDDIMQILDEELARGRVDREPRRKTPDAPLADFSDDDEYEEENDDELDIDEDLAHRIFEAMKASGMDGDEVEFLNAIESGQTR